MKVQREKRKIREKLLFKVGNARYYNKKQIFEKIFNRKLKYVIWERLLKRQCKMSVCIYKLYCPAFAK